MYVFSNNCLIIVDHWLKQLSIKSMALLGKKKKGEAETGSALSVEKMSIDEKFQTMETINLNNQLDGKGDNVSIFA